ncbi:MAG: ABC transporter substrate-binding protein [Chloroflexi bacterium]|nr:ABC transporter substrate-binding protein [Chloroflexota bacterium]
MSAPFSLKTAFSVVLVLLLSLLAACGSSATTEPQATAAAPTATAGAPASNAPTSVSVPAAEGMLKAPESNPKRGGVLQWAGLSDSPHFDMGQCNTAACAEPMGPFFDNLIRYSPFDGGKALLPDLATEWEVSDDGLVYTFHLREGVKFQDGAALTSEDVKATFDRIIYPPTGMVSPRQPLFGAVSEVRTVDSLTVEFVLTAPRAFIPSAIASGWNVIERKKTIDDNNSDLKKLKPGTIEHPGTGPFILESHQSGEFWKLESNLDYWNPELPYLDGIQFNHLPYGPATGAALLTGRVDYVYGAGADLRDDIRANYADTYTAVEYPIPSYGGAWVNFERGPLGDAKVRTAISMVLDRCAIKNAISAIREVAIGTWIMPDDITYGTQFVEDTLGKKPGYRCPVPEEDIAAAQQLLADAGFPNGEGIPKLDIMVRDLNFFVSPTAPMLQAFMKQNLNIDSDIRVVHTSVWQEDQARGNYDLAINGNPTTLAEVAPYFSSYFTTGAGGNWSRGSSHPEFDALVDNLFNEPDPAKQAEFVNRGVEILEEWTPMINLYHFVIVDGFANYVKGHGRANRSTLVNDLRFDTVWLDK